MINGFRLIPPDASGSVINGFYLITPAALKELTADPVDGLFLLFLTPSTAGD